MRWLTLSLVLVCFVLLRGIFTSITVVYLTDHTNSVIQIGASFWYFVFWPVLFFKNYFCLAGGKRQAEEESEKQVIAKKQKIEEVAQKQKKEAKLQKKKESSSDDSSSDSEDEVLRTSIHDFMH